MTEQAAGAELEAGEPATGTAREWLPTAGGAETRAAVAQLLRPRRRLAAWTFAVLVAATAAGLLTAPLLGRIVDVVVAGHARDRAPGPGWALWTPVIALAAAAVVQGALTAAGASLVARLGEGALATLRERFVARAVHLPLGRLEQAGSGDLTSRVTGDVAVVAEAVRHALPELGRSVLTIGLTLVGLAVLDWRFMLVAGVAAPVHLHTVRWYTRHAIPLYAAQRQAASAQQHQLLDTVGGARTVRAFRLSAGHLGRVRERSAATVDLVLRGIRLLTRFYGRLNVAEFAGLAAVLVTGFLLVRAGSVSIGTATAAALYFHGLFNPVNAALALADDAQSAAASLARLVGVAGLPAAAETEPAGRRPVAGVAVKAAGVGHAYVAGHDVLHDVDLEIGAGQRVALVGASGAGKTTLAKLLAGVHQARRGSILVGGAEVGELDAAALRRTVALITQEVHVFAGSLADDLRLARPEATDEELRAALARTGALAWAQALPEGLATVVGGGGHRLTVAQAQQLALARLVLADPPVAILDEATADAGSAGARVLEAATAAALEGRTGLLVAHRLSQAVGADRIVVLDAGRVVETGTHEELVAASGRYAALWAAWAHPRP